VAAANAGLPQPHEHVGTDGSALAATAMPTNLELYAAGQQGLVRAIQLATDMLLMWHIPF